MNYKVVVPTPISQAIGQFGLTRQVLVRLLARIHTDLAAEYDVYRRFRASDNERAFRYRILVDDENLRHLFRLTVDDTTASGHLIIIRIRHQTRPHPPQASS